MQQYFIEDIVSGVNTYIEFSDEQKNHLFNVLRMHDDEIVKVVDLKKQAFLVKLVGEQGYVIEKLTNKIDACEIHLYAGMLKKDKWDYLIQKCCELGVYEITPFVSKRCVVKTNDKTSKKIARYNKIALEACEQSKREHLVKINEVIDLKNLNINNDYLNLVAYEDADFQSQSLKHYLNKDCRKINIVIGPEGGFDQQEIKLLVEKGFNCVSLGQNILRAETAAISVVSNLMFYYEED